MLPFKKITHAIKTKYELTKSKNASWVRPMLVIDTNLITRKALKDIDMAKCVELIVSMFSVNVIGAMAMVDNPVRWHDSKR